MAIKNQDTTIENVHIDHTASCLCCLKFKGSLGYAGSPGYSEWTPGSPGRAGEIECTEGEFSFDEDNSWGEVLTTIHDTARHCKLFAPKAS